jgi:aminoglycoside phosphotransferase (APT) family kinase protein
LDLAWFIARFDPTYPSIPWDPRLPSQDRLLDAYEHAGGASGERFEWFCALAAYKQAAASALINKRSTADDVGDESAVALVRWALRQCETND